MKIKVLAVIVCMLAAVNFASADTIRGINIDFVTIGNAGNAGDTRTGTDQWGQSIANPYGCGAVGYNYRIGKYEVTNAQWNTFTAAAGAPTGTDGGYSYSAYWTGDQQPTNNISWYEAAQFCNYLTSGDKSKGAYQFSGNNTNPGNFQEIDRVSSISTYGTTYVIPTEDEWYKAAYYKPNGSGYSLYANGTDTAPVAGVNSNYDYVIGAPWNITNGTQEQNGTFDMMGNVWEWNEASIVSSYRGLRGGSYIFTGDGDIGSSYRSYNYYYYPGSGFNDIGFRVASVVPEPCSLVLLSIGGLALLRRKRGYGA
jgi:formylglycine-generating enzyme required for sulfatase activity